MKTNGYLSSYHLSGAIKGLQEVPLLYHMLQVEGNSLTFIILKFYSTSSALIHGAYCIINIVLTF